MKIKIVCLLFQIFFYINLIYCSIKCFNNDDEQITKHFATKTAYRYVKNLNDTRIEYPNCNPIKIWGVVRHGSRNPSKKYINRMNTELLDIRDKILKSISISLCEKDLELLKRWRPVYELDKAKYLVAEGEDEMIELAERMQNRIPELFSERYDNSTYKFKFTKTQRTEKSFESFATGLFGRQNIQQIWYAEPLHQDPVLRFYKLCKRWKQNVDKNPQSLDEVMKFAESDLVKSAIQNISSKLGLHDLKWNDIHLMYMTCAFETANLKSGLSPWCSIFDKSTIKIFEFMEDLEYFWIDGYGYPLTYLQACPALVDMIDHVHPDSENPNTTVYFTHSGTILKLLAKLNLYKDLLPLRHTEFNTDRKWHVSQIDAFASNIFIVTYDCGMHGIKFLTLHQERPVHLTGCPTTSDLCDYNDFINIFQNDYTNCNFDELCLL